jgi:hypothetical protein
MTHEELNKKYIEALEHRSFRADLFISDLKKYNIPFKMRGE